MNFVEIWTDGASSPNPGKGGWGAVLSCRGYRRELSGGYIYTTNNRMELLAAIMALEYLDKPCEVKLYSDSQYLVNGMEKGWACSWKSHGWKKSDGSKALNPDLWDRLLKLCSVHKVLFVWVKGHAGNVNNERCDELAVEAASNATEVDENYMAAVK